MFDSIDTHVKTNYKDTNDGLHTRKIPTYHRFMAYAILKKDIPELLKSVSEIFNQVSETSGQKVLAILDIRHLTINGTKAVLNPQI